VKLPEEIKIFGKFALKIDFWFWKLPEKIESFWIFF